MIFHLRPVWTKEPGGQAHAALNNWGVSRRLRPAAEGQHGRATRAHRLTCLARLALDFRAGYRCG